MTDYFDEDAYAKAVKLLARAPRIAASGCGHSGIICQHFAHLMCCIERPARFISPAEAVHGATGYLQKGDVMVFASRGGKTKELLPILDICKAKGIFVITVTENMESPLAAGSAAVIECMHVHASDRKLTEGGSAKFFVKDDGSTVLQERGILTDREIRKIKEFIKQNYQEMYLKWSEYSTEGFYNDIER